MSTPPLKLPAHACDVCCQITLSDDARALLTDRVGPTTYFGQLVEQQLYRDGVRFIPHCMPKRPAVWWGCLCVWETGRPELPAPEGAALQAALRWVQQPTEEHRRAAETAGKAAGAATAAGCLALAAFYSHGSLAPPDQPAVPPPDGLTANTVAGAVLLAAAAAPPKQADERFRHFLSMAVEIANQRLLWQVNLKETGIAPLS